MADQRIRIIGGPGSGKSTLAVRFAADGALPIVELDALFWDGHNARRDPAERDRRLGDVIEQDRWVIEGVYYAWCESSFERADRIILLETPLRTRQWRFWKRFLLRRMGLDVNPKWESLRGALETSRWNARWDRDHLPVIKKVLERYRDKVTVI